MSKTIQTLSKNGKHKLSVLDLFSGIGGFSLGLERTGGFEPVAFCEIAPFPRSVLARHWPNVPIFDDIRTLTVAKLNVAGIYPNVIVGGFPCQDISTSGSGKGLDGERSGLWWEFARLIGEIGPRYVILENSPELLDRWLGDILRALASFGLHAEWHCIPASAVGAPHRRDRIWIIAYAPGKRQPQQRGLIQSLNPEAYRYREASWFVHAVQGGSVPFVCGRHDGVSAKLAADELHALGNAVTPVIPELIGNAILEAMAQQSTCQA